MVKKQPKKSVREDIYEKIRDDITVGRLMAGERLTEKKLLDLYKVSRTPIREALRQLESEGLISFERNKGIEVAKLSIKQVRDIYDIRELLEGYAVRVSIGKMTKKDVSYLEALQKKLIQAAKSNDVQSWLHNNTLFHNFFRDKADNEDMAQLSITLKRRIYRYTDMSVGHRRDYDTYLEQHATLIEACKKRDAALGEETMRLHMRRVRDVITESLMTTRNLMI